MTIDVLFESSGVLAVCKPAGLPTQAPPGITSVESLLRRQCFGDAFSADQAAGVRRHPGGFLGVPHRLDRPVSGVLLLATTPRAARQLSRQFERRQIGKTYLAVVPNPKEAMPAGTTFEWRDMIRKVPDEPRAEIVPGGTAGCHEALTIGRVLLVAGDRSLLALEPRTGRMHQLRVQAASRGMPVAGDTLYGGTSLSESSEDRTAAIALHAWRIRLSDPESGAPTEVSCPLPPGSAWEGWAQATETFQDITCSPAGSGHGRF
jgi:23S rRNA pseudouridine1911/1915/1917 synthase